MATATKTKSVTSRAKSTPATPPSGYRVGSIAKNGRIRWAYDEELTLEEAEEIAASSRLVILAPGVAAPKLLPLAWRAKNRLEQIRLEKSDPAEARRKRLFHTKRWAREQKLNEENGRTFAVGSIRADGKLLRTIFDDLSQDEAEAVVKDTDLSVIPAGQFTVQQLRAKWDGFPRKLWHKLQQIREASDLQKWGESTRFTDRKLPSSRKLTLWVLIQDGGPGNGNIVDITRDEHEAGRRIDSYAISGMRLNAHRMEVTVPTEPTTPKPPRRKLAAKPERLQPSR